MAQAPGGTVVLRSAAGEEALPLKQENYYARGVRLFHDAIAGRGAPPATGEDGVISLSVALAALRSAKSGCAEKIEPGL
jgi:1,5-anhydro-D-fructose reductase (1,5-anhydro-D-mannitol-forming)